MPCVIHWFRRDLRLRDNTALTAAGASGLPILPLYVCSDWHGGHAWTGPNRQQFLCDSLEDLSAAIHKAGGRLIFRQGDAVKELQKLIRESGASAVYFNRDPDPFGRAVEAELAKACQKIGVECHGHHDLSLHAPEEVLTKTGDPYRVFTPYFKQWFSLEKPPASSTKKIRFESRKFTSLEIPSLKVWKLKSPPSKLLESSDAIDRFKRFIRNASSYESLRDAPAAEATSRLSQDLRFGLISIRELHAALAKALQEACGNARQSIETYIKELAWREFYLAILHHFPNVLDAEFQPQWRGLPWDEPGERLEHWKSGQTGFPIVDAGMRQLAATGFMHNRVRMITAMFLTKDLHIDWRAGESWFMQQLVDGEIASNNGGWQWSAGVGADAALYFRIQNPWAQAARHDPEGVYIKRWIPELAKVPAAQLFKPPVDGKPLAKGYPLPCVDHAKERARTLAIFKRHRAAQR